MSASSFRTVIFAGAVAGAALSCYLVSLRVASERNAVEIAEKQILITKKEIRALRTEIGTRGRLAQLERWNAQVIRLSAPQADQFVGDGFALASLNAPEKVSPIDAPVILAAAPAPEKSAMAEDGDTSPAPVPQKKVAPSDKPAKSAADMLYVTSLERNSKPKAEAKPKPAPKVAPKPAPSADPLAPAATSKESGSN